jgi:hypothetical protein
MNKTLLLGLAVAGCTNPDVTSNVTIDLETPSPLTDLAAEAVALAPLWLQHDLALSFQRVEDALQDDLAQVVVDENDPYLVDEIAFAIAHLSPQVLESQRFFPQLLTENAQLVYARDADLDYVQLEDVGEPGVDADYYTTATYRVQTEDGTIETRTIEKEVYSEYEGQWWYITEAVTDIEGVARLTLGEKNQYAVRVISPLGTYPVEENTIAPIIDASVACRLEQITLPALEGSMPAPVALASETTVKEPDMTATIDLQVDGFRLEGNSARGHSFSEAKSAGALDRFVVSETNYDKFLAGESFEAIDHAFRATSETVEVDLVRDTPTYVVLANRETLATAAVGRITVSVDDNVLETPYRLRAGEHLAVRIGD